jgi:flagellar hook-associated protein 3 FlgL
MVGRVSTYSETNYIISLDNTVQAQEAQAQTQESSGLDAQTYGGLGGTTTSLVLTISSQVSQLTASSESATTALANMQESYSVIGNVGSLATSVLTNLSADISGAGNTSTTLGDTASTWLTELSGLLNTQYAGSYLFSGTATDTAPVDTSATGYDPASAPTVANTDYYQGSSTGTTFYGSSGFSVSTSVQANNSAFEMMLRGISLVASDPSSTSTLSQAYSLIQQASTGLAGVQAELSASSASLTQYRTDMSTQVTTLSTLSTNLAGASLPAATVTVTDLSNQLETSYETVSKLMSESLASVLS